MPDDAKGRLLERWQYRQEMVAYNVWSRWGGLPTRDQFERFHDAREMLATMEMWCPAEVPARSLQEIMQRIDTLSPESQHYIHAMTWKRIEQGITGQEYGNLVHLYRQMDPSVGYTPAQEAYHHTVDQHMRAEGIEPYHTHAYQRVREARARTERAREIWDALSPEEQQARIRDAYESRGSDPRVEAAQEQLFAQQREEGQWIGWHEPHQYLEHPAWFLTPSREGDRVLYEMSEAVYDEWRLASPGEQPAVEQTIKAVIERDDGPGEYTVLTPHGDVAFTFTVQDVHQQEQDEAAAWARDMHDPRAYHNLSVAEQRAYEDRPYERLEDEAHWGDQQQVQYPTQYAGMMGSAPERIEIDTSDTEMGQSWHDQLAALDARLEQLAQEQNPHQQHGLRY
jgi:hypothetical protein